MSIHGKDLRTSPFRQSEVVVCKSLVLYDIYENELCQLGLITGHLMTNPSLNLVCIYVGRIYVFLFKNELGSFTLINETRKSFQCRVDVKH